MSFNLTVKPIKQKDAGQRMALIDTQLVQNHELNGEYILIQGPNGTATTAQAWSGYADDEGQGIIRIDGEIRSELGINIDDSVRVDVADVEPAQAIGVIIPEDLPVKGNLEPSLRDEFQDRVVQAGQKISVVLGLGPRQENESIPVSIEATQPTDSLVVVRENTKIEIKQGDPTAKETANQEGEALPDVNYEDIGGLNDEITQIREMIEVPMRHPELFTKLGVEPPRGLLLHGPPGTGKTLLAKAVANEVNAHYYPISGPEIMSKYYGESEERLREVFEKAQQHEPAIIFIDEVDSIASDRANGDSDEFEKRIVSQMLTLMDGLEGRGDVIVIGATNRPDAIDDALRRGGRFDREIEIGVPDKNGRKEILQVHTREMPLADNVDIEAFADRTHGFVGADLAELVKETAMNSLSRVRPDIDPETDEIDAQVLQNLEVKQKDFEEALKGIEPSGMREVFTEVPDVTWEDIGGLEGQIQRLREMVEWPLECPQMFEELSTDPTKGVLLYGPPGTGKTLLAKAVANQTQSNFISIKGPELHSKWMGESEERVREIFAKARENAPSVIFFDEIDALAPQRGASPHSSEVSTNIVSQLLTEMDGLDQLENVVVIGATNRPEAIDDALLRPGRFDEHVRVGLPDHEARKQVFEAHTRGMPLGDVSFEKLAEETEDYSGADIEAVCREAAMITARETFGKKDPSSIEEVPSGVKVEQAHFEHAIDSVGSSLRAADEGSPLSGQYG
ncbi:CDC48 family AAA ATPase [Halorhabdus rudnickae]|uniref:CDC48 family AAA ATPase n=1 Tax=Halorhabdus rudnickae TaxID=1775544 RepID=UPI0010839253|nr:CDC48 family AAA ATPase [Halorhabdus rudnickae]